ncbi:hypothetical protein PIB30_047376 [Stylosanthes scabra]|uniref:Uncharacterized protein n=1 Tax=Stylosanthes scabra TaxID=79078 RepID=A0ABU6XHL8_9FABA|nr:hypothetical protein [Stylosanthes scabra]
MAEEANVGAKGLANERGDGGSTGQPINLDDSDGDSDSGTKRRKVTENKKGVSPRKVVHPRMSKCGKKGKVTEKGKNVASKRMGVVPSGVDGPNGGIDENDSGSDYVRRRKGKGKVYVPKFIQSNEDYVYEYHSDTLRTPVSSEDEYQKYEWPEFDDDYDFGEGHFELGTKFATIEQLTKTFY